MGEGTAELGVRRAVSFRRTNASGKPGGAESARPVPGTTPGAWPEGEPVSWARAEPPVEAAGGPAEAAAQ